MMEHLDFIVWTLLFPVAISVCRYLDSKSGEKGRKTSEGVQTLASLIVLSIWGNVAYMLY